MSHTNTTPPAVLTPEQLTKIAEWHSRLFANYEKHATDETINAAGLGGIGVLLDNMTDLLAHVAARDEQVRQALVGLLRQVPPEDDEESAFDEGYHAAVFAHNRHIEATAATLGLSPL